MDNYDKTVAKYFEENKGSKYDTVFTLPDKVYLKRDLDPPIYPDVVLIEAYNFEDGINVKYVGEDFWHKGYHDLRIHNAVLTPIKRELVTRLRWLIRTGTIVFMLIPKFRWMFLEEFASHSHSAFMAYDRGYLDPEYFCKSGKEIYRMGNEYIQKYEGQRRETAWRVLMFICHVWEYDTIYRYIGQFLLSQSTDPREVINEAYRRTTNQAIKKNLKYLKLLSWFIPKKPLCNLDKNALRLDESDMYFAGMKEGFTWI